MPFNAGGDYAHVVVLFAPTYAPALPAIAWAPYGSSERDGMPT
jgi:hypothetical protein